IYLDHAATTPVDPRVVEAMLPYFSEVYGNPLSTHRLGRKADVAIETARETLARILNCALEEIIFTSCGTESDNLVLRGTMLAAKRDGNRGTIVSARTEHHAIRTTAEQLHNVLQVGTSWIPVTDEGAITPDALHESLQNVLPGDQTIVSIMYANNEIGTIQP